MKKTVTIILLLCSIRSFAQPTPTEQAQPIVAEGKLLYRSEMASWYGTDIFLANYKDQENIGGYFSYTEGNNARCVFYSKAEKPKVIGSVLFDSSYNTRTAALSLKERDFTTQEQEIYTIRNITMDLIDHDTLFKFYDNTSLNLVPLINGNEKKMYILTGTSADDFVVFGNDYLINFDKDNKITGKRKLHSNIIPVGYNKSGKDADGKDVIGSVHSHLPETGEFITATDICTLMLYAKFTGWKQHMVVSEKYVNIWNCANNHLLVIPK
ncbi:MAG: hypothetical protein QM687_05525 [Ferruginibacter sp.]